MFGKTVSDLQTGVTVSDDAITGQLHYVTDYVGFSNVVADQSGNYLAMKVSTNLGKDAVTTVELVGGTKGPVTLDSDMNIVIRIKNPATQTIKVVANKGTETITKVYDLSGLVCESQQ